ncbi:MAG TPA: cellulase family glycosylhydrolase [Solirubrobacteraceae bacterium]|nr:cellulase family glycosylhydrolase [Solirubrobacteraceae bacterium]
MAGRLPKLAALALLCLCASAWLAPSGEAGRTTGTHASSTPPLGGINVPGLYPGARPAEADRAIAVARALHARVVRVDVPWSVLEPRGPGRIEPSAQAFLDRLVGDATAGGIRVIVSAESTPCWASSAPPSLLRRCVPGGSSKANAWPPREPSAYAAFVAYLAARYGTRLAAIEVWNEPDQANEAYFAGPEKPQHYAAVLRAAYPAIKRANPNVTVLAGSLVGSNGVFLRALYAAGIKGYYDGLAVHFYNLTLGSLRAIHETQLANGDDTPLWLDEFGWSSCWPRQKIQQEQGCVSPAVQAANITNLYRSLVRAPYVAAAVLYKLQDSPSESFGVLNTGGARKPAFAALARVLANPFGSPSRVTLSLSRRHGGVLAEGEGPVGDYMQLEAFQGKVLRYRALFTLDRFNRYAIPLPRALGTHGLTVRVYQYWQGAGSDAQRSI